MSSEQTALLLYFLLHGNQNVASFIFSRSDIDALVIPLVEQLHAHKVGEDSSHHLYMLLIIFLILSQDEVFNKTIHEIVSLQQGDCVDVTCIRTCKHAFVHVYLHVLVCIDICMYMQTCEHAFVHVYVHVYVRIDICMYMQTCEHAFVHVYVHVYVRIDICMYMQTCICACVSTCICTYMIFDIDNYYVDVEFHIPIIVGT